MKSLTTRVPFTKCPHCGHKLDSATSYKGHQPSEGCISVCVECGALSAFNADLTRRELTPEEARAVSLEPEIMRLQLWIRGGKR